MDSNTRGKNNKKNEGDYVKIDVDVIHTLRECGVKNGNEVILFCKILSLSKNPNGACIAGNEYLANVIGVSERSVQDYIRNLKKLGVIKTFEQKVGCQTTTRYIYPQNIKDIAHAEPCTQYVPDHTQDHVLTTRRITSKDTQTYVEPHAGSRQTTRRGLHPILEENRIDKNREDVAAEAAPYCDVNDENEKFQFLSPTFNDQEIIQIIERDYYLRLDDINIEEGETLNDIKEKMIKEFSDQNGFYKCDYETVKLYISSLFKEKENK